MTDYNKTNLIQGAVILAVAIVLFFTIIAFVGEKWWAIPFPVAATIYGCVAFVKKYYPKHKK